MIWIALFCLFTPMVFQGEGASLEDCVAKRDATICYGSETAAGDRDWIVETRDASGRIRRYTEHLPYDQEARRVAISIASGWIVYIVHSRWFEEFSTRLETRWEIVLFDAGGSIRKRLDLPGKPDGLFDLGGYLFVAYPDGRHRTYDRNLDGMDGLPDVVVLTLAAAFAIMDDAVWLTPTGEPDEFAGVGHYRLMWNDQDGRLDLHVTVFASIEGVSDGATYPGKVSFVSDAPLSVDGAPSSLSGTIDSPGRHNIVVIGHNGYRLTWNVLVKPTLFGLPSEWSTGTVRLYSNAVMKLNGEPYAPGTPIEQAGTYEIALLGAGNYQESHSFTIASSATNVWDSGVYEAPWTFHINGTGLLNGIAVSGETTIHAAGDYELAFWDDPSAPRLIRFVIVAKASQPQSVDSSAYVQVGLAVLAILGLYFVRKRK